MSNRRMFGHRASMRNNFGNNKSNNNNNNRKQNKPNSSASSIAARLSLFERVLAARGERFRINPSDNDSTTSLSNLAAQLSEEMGTLIDLMNLVGDLPSSREDRGSNQEGRSIEEEFPPDELYELTSAAAGLLLSESEERFEMADAHGAANEDSDSERSKTTDALLKNEVSSFECPGSAYQELAVAEDASTDVLTATESQDSLLAGLELVNLY